MIDAGKLLLLFFILFIFTNSPSPSLAHEYSIIVKISEQKLYLMSGNEVSKTYAVSTSRYGIGNRIKSNKTPLGMHRVAEKIGEGAPLGAIFDGKRRYTGETSIIYIDDTKLSENYELTRIIWLEGMESTKAKALIHSTEISIFTELLKKGLSELLHQSAV